MRIGVVEILLILLSALLLFGGRKLAGLGKSLGQSEEGNHEVSSDTPRVS